MSHPTDKFAELFEEIENSGLSVLATYRVIALLQNRYEEANVLSEAPPRTMTATPKRLRPLASGISLAGQPFVITTVGRGAKNGE